MIYLEFDRNDYFRETDKLISLMKEQSELHEIFTNLVIIDLVINLETFLERTLESYIKSLIELDLQPSKIHKNIKKEHLKFKFNRALELAKHIDKDDKLFDLFSEISDFFNDKNIQKIEIDLNLGMGKHGEKEIAKLFHKIGFINIFESCLIIDDSNSSILDNQKYLNVEKFIQDIIRKRNLAIHNGISFHSEFSIQKLEKYSKYLEIFLKYVIDILNFSIEHHRNI